MAASSNEPRALGAALSGPVFSTRGAGVAMHVADRHVERWAPEASAQRVRPLRSLGFVDRLIAPWMETAQRSTSLRLFGQYTSAGFGERAPFGGTSWVFPRPWYQDELDWMAAARNAQMTGQDAPLLTTRGTYVESAMQLPAALYEYVAPSLSVASPQSVDPSGAQRPAEAYSSLVPLAAVQAAELMARVVSPTIAAPQGHAMPPRANPQLRSMLASMLARATAEPAEPTRLAMQAPELVTPPAPRAPSPVAEQPAVAPAQNDVAEQYAEQRARIVEVQRIAQQMAARELAAQAPAAPAPSVAPSAIAATRAAAQQAEAELRRAATPAAPADAPRAPAAPVDTTADERARIEQRIAQRLAERTQQRLHEQSRSEAAEHARVAPAPAVVPAAPAPAIQRRPPAEVLAAVAALPPELAAVIAQQPDRTIQAIDELSGALRAIELMARADAPMPVTRGPRLMLPAGMGGLVASIDRAHAIAERPAMLAGTAAHAPRPIAPAFGAAGSFAPAFVQPTAAGPRAARAALRPAMSFVAPAAAPAPAATTALGAAIGAEPAALGHVAWADRWLARFAGASPASLATFAATGASPMQRMLALAEVAPAGVFVAPTFDIERAAPAPRFEEPLAPLAPIVPIGSAAPSPRYLAAQPLPPPALRFDDAAETPDDVFAAIASASASTRAATRAPAPPPTAAERPAAYADRATPADTIAHSLPGAPGAGFAAQLASSPFAPALRHVLPLPAAASFDVRALFGGELSAAYLANILATDAGAHTLDVGRALPSWASWLAGFDTPTAGAAERMAPSWDAAYVAPEDVGIGREAAIAEAQRAALDELPDTGMAAALAQVMLPEAAPAQPTSLAAPLTTLRSALLSWDVPETAAAGPLGGIAPAITQGPSTAVTPSTARTLLESMSLPMLGDISPVGDQSSVWTGPGMVANRAHSWSVAQERSTSDLALDFVTPELVLAARVYGLGPAEAAQAARLAIAGPGQLSAMASTVDRAFVTAMAIDEQRRAAIATAPSLAMPSGDTAAVLAPSAPQAARALAATAGEAAAPIADAPAAPTASEVAATPGSSFGVPRRTPRGAFLWPSASVGALGLGAAAPDGELSMSVAALEMLAAQAVAEIGTYAALGEPTAPASGAMPGTAPSDDAAASDVSAPMPVATAAPTGAPAGSTGSMAEPAEHDVLAAAEALVPAGRRSRFEALYVALGRTPAGGTWSPAARAARALALASRGTEDGTVISARERAALAWDVLPVVYADDGTPLAAGDDGDGASFGSTTSGSTGSRGRAMRGGMSMPFATPPATAPDVQVDTRPGLAALSARAGEALGSFVTPATAPAPASSGQTSYEREQQGAVLRAPTAAQELVRTGRPAGRHGGGETEIPAWFESAARAMLEQRGSVGSDISLAELTLVTAAPASHIAASTRAVASATPSAPAQGSADAAAHKGAPIDIDSVANDVYRAIMVMMDGARMRNGDPQ